MENFVPHIRNRTNDTNTILQELTLRQYYKPQARPPFSANLLRFALHLRYISCQAYKLLLEKLPLPPLGLLQKISQGNVDSLKALKLLLSKGAGVRCLMKCTYRNPRNTTVDISLVKMRVEICIKVLLFLCWYPYRNLYRTLFKSIPITSIRDEWLADEIDKCITVLKDIGFLSVLS